MNAYLFKKLNQLNKTLSDIRPVIAEYNELQARLAELSAQRDAFINSFDVNEACELLELTNQIEGTHFVLDVSSYVIEEHTAKNEVKENKPVVAEVEDNLDAADAAVEAPVEGISASEDADIAAQPRISLI